MTRPIAVLIGLVVGIAVGAAAERLPVGPLAQSLIAVVAGSLLASIASAAVWIRRPPPEAEVLAVSFGLTEALLTSMALLLVGLAAHTVLAWGGPHLHAAVLAHRATLMALLGALWAALACTSGLGMVTPQK